MSNPETKKTLPEKLAKLDESVNWFYSENFSLEKALENYKSAINLAKEIESDLKTLKNEIEILSQDFSEK